MISTESPNSIRDVAIEGNSNAPSEDNTLAITEFDNIDQRMTVDRGSISGICHLLFQGYERIVSLIFSLPEPKAQVSFSGYFLSVCLSV